MCGATTLLAHFHFAKGSVPFQHVLDGQLAGAFTQAALLPEQIEFVASTASLVNKIRECFL